MEAAAESEAVHGVSGLGDGF